MAKRILLITSVAGGGHLQAAQVKTAEHHADEVICIDILKDSIGKLGGLCAWMWNRAQKRGDFRKQKWFSRQQPLADFFFWIPIFFRVVRILVRNDIDKIVDTQPVGTSAVVYAIKWARRITKKELVLEKILTELPSSYIPHFFAPLAFMSKKDRQLVRFETIPPLKEDELFWRREYGLSQAQIVIRPPLLRKAFYDILEQAPIIDAIEIATPTGYAVISIPLDVRVTTIMLGSHPPEAATLKYISAFIEAKRDANSERDMLFVFARSLPLLKAIELLRPPPGLEIIPLIFQEDKAVAPLLYRSNATLTKSGGLTSMELLAIANGRIWIHSESSGDEPLLEGMPIWEAGNARYLAKAKNAQCITPALFKRIASDYFRPLA